MRHRWFAVFAGLLLTATGVLSLPALSLIAYTPDHTYVVSPTELRMEATVGADVTNSFTVSPGLGNFTEVPVGYRVSLGNSYEDYCLARDEDGMECIGGYDYEMWASEGLLCEYLTLETESASYAQSGTLELPDDPDDTISVTLSVPCVGEACPQHPLGPLPFPASLLDRELTCDITAGEKVQVSMLAPDTAYAQSEGSVVRVTGVVHRDLVVENTLTLSAEVGYDSTRGVVSSGPYPERGVADKDVFTFKVVYTDPSGALPTTLEVQVGTTIDSVTSILDLTIDTSAAPTLHDGDTANGEQYVATSTFQKNRYFFAFHGTTTEGDTIDLRDDEPAFLNNSFTFQAGYSSILFLPGIKGSELWHTTIAGTDDQLWFPSFGSNRLFGNDVEQLRMTNVGESVVNGIYAPEVLTSVFDVDVYKTFRDSMNELVTQGHIRFFEALPYDWRYDVRDVVANPIPNHADSTYSMPDEVVHVAQELSDSGKVIIIGHSMGGLVGKALIALLEEEDTTNQVEKFVMVGTPQLGTPSAIPSLLNGTGQGKENWGPDIITESDVRKSGQYMPGAYNLLPIGTYNLSHHPVVTFGSTTGLTPDYRNIYGAEIRTANDLKDFLAGTRDGRQNPGKNSLNEPIVLSRDLLNNKTEPTRNFLDTWVAPQEVEVIEFAGVNRCTIDSVEFKKKEGCIGDAEKCLLVDPKVAGNGDVTVSRESAQAQQGANSFEIDLSELGNFEHYNLMNIPDLLTVLGEAVSSSTLSIGSTIKPKGSNYGPLQCIVMQTFSPVRFTVEDDSGDMLAIEHVSGSDLEIVRNTIPHSQYYHFGDMQMVVLPASKDFTIQLEGTATGTLQLEFEEYEDGELTHERVHTRIPVTEGLTSMFTLTNVEEIDTIWIDSDGNGTNDVTLSPSHIKTPLELVQELKTYTSGLSLNRLAKNLLLVRIAVIEQFVKHGKTKPAIMQIDSLKDMLRLYERLKLVPRVQGDVIIGYLDEIRMMLRDV
jgi:pimeloyl-ACP methyl ester carboxylesterase